MHYSHRVVMRSISAQRGKSGSERSSSLPAINETERGGTDYHARVSRAMTPSSVQSFAPPLSGRRNQRSRWENSCKDEVSTDHSSVTPHSACSTHSYDCQNLASLQYSLQRNDHSTPTQSSQHSVSSPLPHPFSLFSEIEMECIL